MDNISAFTEKNGVTWAWFTPSFLRTLRPQEVPGLVTIAVGELLIEGSILAQGYLDEPEKTATAFIQSPKWTTRFQSLGHPRTFYRTGDLVQYNAHGTIRYIGRNDSQVKINGRRTELGVVENHSNSISGAFDVIVVAATPKDGQHELVLAAFLAPKEDSGESLSTSETCKTKILPITDDVSTDIQRIKVHLSGTLPSYMVPSIFVPISGIPLTVTGKMDQLFLRKMISNRLRAEPVGATHETVAGDTSLTGPELAIRSLVANAFTFDPATIDMHQNFMQLGGDSLVAIKLISIGRRNELVLTVEQLLTASSLLELAKFLKHDTSIASKSFPFEHFKDTEKPAHVLASAIEQCNVSKDQIEDIYPTTGFQANFMFKNGFHLGMYAGRFVYRLPSNIDPPRFRRARKTTINATPILRSRLVQASQGEVFQVVIDYLPEWTTYPSLDNLPGQELGKDYRFGRPLLYLATAGTSDLNDGVVHFILEIQHALYDGFSFSHVLEQAQAAYEGQDLVESKFSPFVRYLQKQDMATAKRFWDQELLGTKAIPFPTMPSPEHVPVAAIPGSTCP
ncbi:uncharacterized protein PAC_16560 [Phialocephala subalpina]|uniref:Carrier domain-containing protein n=1 Tax=Phialocephala subalpina TaxID=576137 RepID=A0A1L7XNP8_9HELO|nr:uncharacterized protein PAC_16560 [Phialocephala subalpina]